MWRKWWFWLIIVIVVGGGTVAAVQISAKKQFASSGGVTTTESEAIKAGKRLANNHCDGSGSVPLTSGPMKPAQIGVILPYGLTVGGHVTPIDHQYYWAKNNVINANDVLALADGTMVDIEYRDHHGQGSTPGDYRVVISYTCTFFSYFDLATSLVPDIASQLPNGWEKDGRTTINIPVKAGQVIAKVGAQTLDFAVWDMTKNNSKLLVPAAYGGEDWKIHTVNPLDYFEDSVKTALLPFYARQAEPRDGYYAYDIEGKLIGTWFLQGTKGYSGISDTTGAHSYWAGHLAIAPDAIDPTVFGFSVGQYNGGEATQFIIVPPLTDPKTVGVDSGLIKLELIQGGRYQYSNGAQWDGMNTPTDTLIMPTTGTVQAVALVQLTNANTLKLEIFPGKTASQVAAFTTAVKIYTRSGN